MKTEIILHRTLHTQTRVLDAKAGIVEYVASDETLDSYHEVIRANGWRFDHFSKNAPFLVSHQSDSIAQQVGKVLTFEVKGAQLVESVQWAIDVPENEIAQLGWKMTEAGYLKAVSVGFMPVRMISKWETEPEARRTWDAQVKELGLEKNPPRAIYLEQQQVELSACVLGANPNALARAFKAEVITEAELELLATRRHPLSIGVPVSSACPACEAAAAAQARQRQTFLDRFKQFAKKI